METEKKSVPAAVYAACGVAVPQLSGRGLFRKPTAGVDVRGDGTFVPFKGGVVREELDPTHHDTPFDLVRETLEAEER